ncbi:hypothetical protein EYF80_052279 [Liparis tanakae]|uniref:Uncharacterized protein n=1 Tax=Liparis tanakae TaxID=230148 RepID=A0A4Z2F8S0_9TELE|nr:hypothetical protein EYF80_052279 [Liparis tanakae]
MSLTQPQPNEFYANATERVLRNRNPTNSPQPQPNEFYATTTERILHNRNQTSSTQPQPNEFYATATKRVLRNRNPTSSTQPNEFYATQRVLRNRSSHLMGVAPAEAGRCDSGGVSEQRGPTPAAPSTHKFLMRSLITGRGGGGDSMDLQDVFRSRF